MKFEPRQPVPAVSVAARCGEGEVTVEVRQNFLGNGCRFLVWIDLLCFFCFCFFVQSCTGPLTMASSLLSEKGRVRLEGARIGEIEWNGEDGTLSADYCKWHRLMDRAINIMFPLVSSLGERSILRWSSGGSKRWLYSDALRNLFFYLSCGWTSTCPRVLLTGPGGEMASGNGPYLSCAFFFSSSSSSSLFLGNGQLIRPSDLTLGGCAARDAADHILHFQTELQGCGSTLTVCGSLLSLRPSTFFFLCVCVCI